jgi:REP element-mobilizing transposase RayT
VVISERVTRSPAANLGPHFLLGRALPPLAGEEYGLLVDAVAESRQKLHFLLYGYVLMPDHWHALIWTTYPLTISRVVQDIKRHSASALNRARRTSGTVWQHQFWDRFVPLETS